MSEPKPTKMDLYKQSVDEWLEETPYSALRILEKLRKMDLNEKAAVRFETMPGERDRWTGVSSRITWCTRTGSGFRTRPCGGTAPLPHLLRELLSAHRAAHKNPF
mgnify:FL=1